MGSHNWWNKKRLLPGVLERGGASRTALRGTPFKMPKSTEVKQKTWKVKRPKGNPSAFPGKPNRRSWGTEKKKKREEKNGKTQNRRNNRQFTSKAGKLSP